MGDTPFCRLPDEIILEIGSNLEASDLAALIRTCRRCYNSMQDMLYDVAVTYTLNLGTWPTVLEWAALQPKQRKYTLTALVRKGADIYVKGARGTLLHDAAMWGDEETVDLLVRSGIHPWTVCHGAAPFVYASERGDESMVRYLLYDALNIWQRDAPQHAMTFEESNRVTIAWDEAERRWYFEEALTRAAEGGHLATVKLLCRHVDVSKRCMKGTLFTTSASAGGSTEVMQMLLGLGAELDPLASHTAASHGHLALVLDIISRRPMDVFHQDDGGCTPLHYAANGGHADVVQMLLDHGVDHEVKERPVDVFLQDGKGRTPLHYAAKGGHADVVQTLLDHGVDHEVEDNEEYTALDLAFFSRRADVIRILRDMPISTPPSTDDESYTSDVGDEDWEIETV